MFFYKVDGRARVALVKFKVEYVIVVLFVL